MNKQIVKSNSVIEAAYRLSLNEQRLILLCIEQIRKGQVVSKADTFTISAAEIAKAFSITIDRAYTALQEVADKLYERSLLIYKADDETRQDYTKTRWISAIDYVKSESKVCLYFAPKVIPYISMLESGFTRYNLEYIAPMTSAYGIRFYELLKCWLMGDKNKVKSIELDTLKELLGVEGLYPSIKDFKLKVIERGLSDVNTHTDLSVTYENHKTGRKVTGLTFTIDHKKNKAANPLLGTKEEAYPLPLPAKLEQKQEDKRQEEKEKAADLAHLKKMAELAGVPLENLLKRP